MIKIVYVINYIVKNGPSSVVLNLINNLDREQYDVSLITLFSENDPEVVAHLKDMGVSVYECTTLSRMKCLLGQSKEFGSTVRNGQFDILHTHGLIPDVVSSQLNTPAKKIATIHNNMYEDYLDSYGWVKSRIFIALHLNALKKLNECVCCSESVYKVMKRKLNNTTFIRNGIEPVHAQSVVTREKLNIPDNARVFLYAGVLNSRKNIVWMIEKFVQYHKENEYLLVLGKGDKEAECKEKMDSHVRMLGFQPDPIAYMNISDVYTSASKSEGFSISVLEALSCGVGLFLSDIPSHGEVVGMGQDVYLGETFDAANFNDQMTLLRKGKLDRKKIAEFQKYELSAKGMTVKYMKCYEEGKKLMQKEKMANTDLISILMPTYNVEKFVEEAVRSVLCQTYKNFELIIVDDCSTDKTFEILTRLAKEDNRIKLYRNEVNSKICKTLNKAFQHSSGAYIGRMDGDDVSTPERFEILKQFLDENEDIDLVGSNIITIDEDGNELAQKRYIKTNQYIQWGNRYQPCVSHIWLARREVYDALNGYREVPYVEDWDFLLRGENQGFKYANVDAFIYKCRIRNGNTGATNGLRQRKAGRYILKLYKREKKSHRDEFDENSYLKAIRYTEREQKKYRKAAEDLNIAIHSRSDKLRLIKYVLKAFGESEYIARYLYDVTIVRLLQKVENKNEM